MTHKHLIRLGQVIGLLLLSLILIGCNIVVSEESVTSTSALAGAPALEATATPTPAATNTPVLEPMAASTEEPTVTSPATAAEVPTDTPAPEPTGTPTEGPTTTPTLTPTVGPTNTPPPTATPTPTAPPPPPMATPKPTPARPEPAGRLLYSVANLDEQRWELWEYNFAAGSNEKIADWRTEVDLSQDGQQIAYFAWPGDVGEEQAGIWIMDADFTNDRLVIGGGAYPSFNPGGDRLVVNGGPDMYLINTDGGGLRFLATGEYPDWSPINNEIVHRACLGGACGLYVIDANSPDPYARRRLTTGASDGQPAWSPDGGQIAYISQDDGNFEIYLMNADGAAKTRLTENPSSDGLPVRSPDGEWIAFRSDRGGSWAIYLVRPDGSDLRKLIEADVLPLWFFEKMVWRP